MNGVHRTTVMLALAVVYLASSGCTGWLTGGWELPTHRQVHQSLEKREPLSYSEFCARHEMKPLFSRPVIFPSHWNPEKLREALRTHGEEVGGNRFFFLEPLWMSYGPFGGRPRRLRQQGEITPESWRRMIFDDVPFETFGVPPQGAVSVSKTNFHEWFPGAEETFTFDGEVQAHYMLNGKLPNAFGGIDREYDVIFEQRDVIVGYMRLYGPRGISIIRDFDFYFPPLVRRVHVKGRLIQYYLNNRPRLQEASEESKAWYLNGQLKSVRRLEEEDGHDISPAGSRGAVRRRLWRYQLWNEDGDPVFDKGYSGRVLHGRCREWDDNGKLTMDTLYDMGMPVREHLNDGE